MPRSIGWAAGQLHLWPGLPNPMAFDW